MQVQFQKGLSLPQFLKQCGTEEQCRSAEAKTPFVAAVQTSERGHPSPG
jgi:hypothetical protein